MPKVLSALLSGFDLILTWWRRLNGSPRLMSHWYVDLPGWRHAHHQALATQEYHLANDLHTDCRGELGSIPFSFTICKNVFFWRQEIYVVIKTNHWQYFWHQFDFIRQILTVFSDSRPSPIFILSPSSKLFIFVLFFALLQFSKETLANIYSAYIDNFLNAKDAVRIAKEAKPAFLKFLEVGVVHPNICSPFSSNALTVIKHNGPLDLVCTPFRNSNNWNRSTSKLLKVKF